MKGIILNIKSKAANTDNVFSPTFFRLHKPEDKQAFKHLLRYNHFLKIHDEIDGQLRELIKSYHPSVKIKHDEYPEFIDRHLDGRKIEEYGVWVYYPWSNKLIHLLDEEEFVEIRTNRNRYKITREEQKILSEKKIGIVGLSVGQSIALTLAMERTCGELRLADFDTAELSNLNRIRTGLHNLGLKKTIIAAREIAEIDPYLKVSIYDGLNKENIDSYFADGGKLDLLVEVCDGLDIKIISRFKARELKIPVVMDTNDRGMLDVERFDLEPQRPILHGLAGDLDPQKITNLTNEEKIPYILKMIGAESISTRLKASMLEVEQSINTWPQLASSVTLGGAITTDVCRRIFLNHFNDSGRYYLDIEDIIKNKNSKESKSVKEQFPAPAKLSVADLESIADKYTPSDNARSISKDQLTQIVEAACLAPSGGNSQPWMFLYRNNHLYIYHDAHYSYSLLDLNNAGSYIAFGAMLENIILKAASLNLSVTQEVFPLKKDRRLIAVLSFINSDSNNNLIHLAPVIGSRVTNRNVTERKLLRDEDKFGLSSIAASIPEAKLQLFDDERTIKEFAEILTNTERIRFLHPQGHYDTFVNELRFSPEEVEKTADGMDVRTLNLKESDIAALKIARDPSAISFLHNLHQGLGFKKISQKNVLQASSIGVVTMTGRDPLDFLQGGRAVERIWLEANYRGIAFQPISQIVFMTEILTSGVKVNFNSYEKQELSSINERFRKLLKIEDQRYPVFVFRLCYADEPEIRSLRRPLNEVFHVKELQAI
jgi:nitroreductase/molybdopterin/thiamine biosynthesis adenylyltransferase